MLNEHYSKEPIIIIDETLTSENYNDSWYGKNLTKSKGYNVEVFLSFIHQDFSKVELKLKGIQSKSDCFIVITNMEGSRGVDFAMAKTAYVICCF